MKNRTIIILAALFLSLCPSFANARNSHKKVLTKEKKQAVHDKILSHLLKPSCNPIKETTAKTTVEYAERLIAQSDYGNNFDTLTFLPIFGIMDSLNFRYTSDRSSYFNYNYMKYYNIYEINGNYPFGYGSAVGFKDHNDLPDMLSDTSMIWNIDPFTLIYGLNETRYSIYDTNNNITNFTDYYQIGIGYRYINTYDANTNIATSLEFQVDTTSWDSSEFRVFIYSSSHQLIMDSTNQYLGGGAWGPNEKFIYSYDSYSNLTQISYYLYDSTSNTWGEDYRWVVTYYTSNKIQSLTLYSFDTSSALLINTIDSFGWTSGLNYFTYQKVSEFNLANSDSLMDYWVYTKHVSVDSLPDTMRTAFFDKNGMQFSNQFTAYSYDSYSEPTIAYTYTYDSFGLHDSITGIAYYYYGLYEKHNHANSVTNTMTPPETINIYPNPATNQISISRPGVAKGAYTYIQLINAAGQTVRTESLPWLSETESISVAGLTPGMYWLVLQDKGGNVLCRQAVVKK